MGGSPPEREKRGEGKPETFTFLGFTHHCGKRRNNRTFIVWRKTAKKCMVAKLHAIKAELRRRMHEPVADVGAWQTGRFPSPFRRRNWKVQLRGGSPIQVTRHGGVFAIESTDGRDLYYAKFDLISRPIPMQLSPSSILPHTRSFPCGL